MDYCPASGSNKSTEADSSPVFDVDLAWGRVSCHPQNISNNNCYLVCKAQGNLTNVSGKCNYVVLHS